MKGLIGISVIAVIVAAIPWSSRGQELERQMNVQQGPDSVFENAPGEIFPELADATATSENGRVGNELVFWGYRLADGREVYLVACAMVDDIDCATRESRVCLSDSRVLTRGTSPGLVREINCRSIATVAPGDIRPGCTDRENSQVLAVSLVTCL